MRRQTFISLPAIVYSVLLLILLCSWAFHLHKTQTLLTHNDPLAEHLDKTIRPGDDFFNYANGTWIKSNPIPPSENSNGIFLLVQDSIDHTLRLICEVCSSKPGVKGSNSQKIGDFFASGMDTIAREKEGLKPIESELNLIRGIQTKKDLMKECARLHRMDCAPMFSFYISRDDKLSSRHAVFIHQGGLGLPDRDYYFNTDQRTKNIRTKYEEHVCKVFELMGKPHEQSKTEASDIMEIEKALAASCRKMEDLRDPYKNYNKLSLDEFNKLSPSINWKEIFSELGVSKIDSVIAGQPEFISALDKSLNTIDLKKWKIYFEWELIENYSHYSNKTFEEENFNFNNKTMTGAKEQKPRWKRMVELSESALNELLSQEYVVHYLPSNTKEKLTEIGKNILSVYASHLKSLDWMSAETKEKALRKLDRVVMKMGYPDKWKDYSKLEIGRGSLITNIMHVAEWNYNYMLNKLGKPVDRTEWVMTAETYNAYYEPTLNEIVIPGCNIIIPGFGNAMPDDAVLYGVIGGSTMGHEITHGFDDEGSQYDEQGNLHNWWTEKDRDQFNDRTKKLAEQFDKYVVLDSLHVRGMATLGENIADLGGVIMGYEAFKKTDQWKKNIKINGQTPDQRYFLSYAYSWLVARRNESLAKQIMTDVHAPAQWRVNGPLSNITAFYTAFGVTVGNKMYRVEKDRIKIW